MDHPTRRVFAALVPPRTVREEIALRLAASPGVRWTPAANMHITLVFDAACPDVPALILRLASTVLGQSPFRMTLGGAGAFETRRGATVWMAAEGAGEADKSRLRDLRVASGSRADAVGHLTLARVREPSAALAAVAALPRQEWAVETVQLFESAPGKGPGGRPRYDLLARLPFAAPAGRIGS